MSILLGNLLSFLILIISVNDTQMEKLVLY